MPDIQTKFEDAILARDFAGVRDAVDDLPPSELAALIQDLPIKRQTTIFRILPRRLAAATFEYLPLNEQEEMLRSLAQEDVAAILNQMSPDDRTMLLEELPAAATRQLLALLNDEERAEAVKLLGYPEGSVGRLMTPHYIAVRPYWTVRDVLDYVRRHGQDSETLNLVYVVDEGGVLIDDIRMRRFLLADPEWRVSDLMDNRFTALKATDDRHTAVNVFRQADLAALPVTDSEGALIVYADSYTRNLPASRIKDRNNCLKKIEQAIFKQSRTVDAALRQFPVDYREGSEQKIDEVKKIRLRAVNDLLGDGRVIKTSDF